MNAITEWNEWGPLQAFLTDPNINEINQVAARLALVGWPLADHC